MVTLTAYYNSSHAGSPKRLFMSGFATYIMLSPPPRRRSPSSSNNEGGGFSVCRNPKPGLFRTPTPTRCFSYCGPVTRPPTAHISRVVMEENGKELEIVRHSFPYGTVSESGLFFIAYTRNLDIPEKMLSRMYGTAGDGLHDRLMDFTRAVTGATFFAPSLEVLKSLSAR